LNIDCSMFLNWRTSRFICILRFTKWTISMSNSIRIWIVLMSWDEYHEMWLFVNRSIELSCWDLLLISCSVRWKSEHDDWIDEFDWQKISWDYRASLLDLKETVRWLDVTYPYSGRRRNSLVDMNRLRFYFNNLIDMFIKKQWSIKVLFEKELYSTHSNQIKRFQIQILMSSKSLIQNDVMIFDLHIDSKAFRMINDLQINLKIKHFRKVDNLHIDMKNEHHSMIRRYNHAIFFKTSLRSF
jgi:hypothetical protein